MALMNFAGKTRDDILNIMYRLANKAIKEDSYKIERIIWSICYDWNSQNEDAEIFMSEIWDDEEDRVNGFCIEDDYWKYNE